MISLTVSRTALRAAAPTRQFAAAAASSQSIRYASTRSLQDAVAEVVPAKQEQLKKLKADSNDKSLGEIKVENLIGGMRGLKVMLWEGSVLDANTGITFHGKSIPDCEKILPTSKDLGLPGKEMRESILTSDT
jgi:citrate synthase